MKRELMIFCFVFILFGMLLSFPTILADHGNDSDGVCEEVYNERFRSINQYEVGPIPEGGVAYGYWWVIFSDNTVEWAYSDIVETGTFTCENGIINASINNREIEASYDEGSEILTWDGIEYKERDENEIEEEIEIEIEQDADEIEIEIETEGYKRSVRAKGMTAEQVIEAFRERNRLRLNQSEIPENCTQTGSVISCNISGGRVMAVMAGVSGNTIIKVRGVNMTTQVELYHHSGKVYGILENNESKIINFFPDQLREIIRQRIQARLADENETIELDEDGEYEVEIKKRSRFLGVFKVKEKVRFHIDPETGEILNERAPWWGFLANDEEE
jgi:hypothetical protein